jgi:hypothetical protein
VAELRVVGLLAMVEAVPRLAVSGVGPVPGLAVSGMEGVPGLAVSGVRAVRGLAVSGMEAVPGLLAGGRDRFGAGLAAAPPFGDDRGTDRRLAGAGHRLASCCQTT